MVIVFVQLPIRALVVDRNQVVVEDQRSTKFRPVELNPIGQYLAVGSSREDFTCPQLPSFGMQGEHSLLDRNRHNFEFFHHIQDLGGLRFSDLEIRIRVLFL